MSFEFNGTLVRTARLFTGEIVYCLVDISKVLRTPITTLASALDDYPDECRIELFPTPGGSQHMRAVTAAGLLRLVMRPRKSSKAKTPTEAKTDSSKLTFAEIQTKMARAFETCDAQRYRDAMNKALDFLRSELVELKELQNVKAVNR